MAYTDSGFSSLEIAQIDHYQVIGWEWEYYERKTGYAAADFSDLKKSVCSEGMKKIEALLVVDPSVAETRHTAAVAFANLASASALVEGELAVNSQVLGFEQLDEESWDTEVQGVAPVTEIAAPCFDHPVADLVYVEKLVLESTPFAADRVGHSLCLGQLIAHNPLFLEQNPFRGYSGHCVQIEMTHGANG